MMRVLFAGSPQFAVIPLEAVCRKHAVCGVLTNPDRPAGRSRIVPTPVKRHAEQLKLRIYQPDRLDESFLKEIRALKPDILVVVAFGKIFKREFLEIFSEGGINLHPSLLPRFRGASPIPAAILAGESETGITVQRLSLKMDSGNILAVEKIPLTGGETSAFLYDKLFSIGAGLLISTLDAVKHDTVQERPQREEEATYCRIVKKDDGRINWNTDAVRIDRMVRAYNPWPRAFTTFNKLHLKILGGGVYPDSVNTSARENGLVLGVDKRYGILVNTGKGFFYINSLQLQSRKPLDWRSFLNGQKDFIGSLLGGNQ